MTINMPDYVKKAIETLNNHGFEAYVAGGAVRDTLLGTGADDWDIATNARTEDVQKCFPRHFDTGIKHGTVTVLVDGKAIEITTYRIEGEYENNRRPKSVEFSNRLSEDLKRRDFTINAMAYNDKTGLVDLFGGRDDLENKIIRCVGNPDERFNEDALRIMRGVRFASRLNFKIEQSTFESIKRNCHLLKNISAERIQSELVKTLLTAKDVEILFSSGIMNVVFPEVKNNTGLINRVAAVISLKLAALFWGTERELCRTLLNRLKFDNKTKEETLQILKCAQEELPLDEISARRFLSCYDYETVLMCLNLLKAWGINVKKSENLLKNAKKYPHKINMLAVTGNDVVSLGYEGKNVGEAMKYLLECVIQDPSLNTKEQLLNLIVRNQ